MIVAKEEMVVVHDAEDVTYLGVRRDSGEGFLWLKGTSSDHFGSFIRVDDDIEALLETLREVSGM